MFVADCNVFINANIFNVGLFNVSVSFETVVLVLCIAFCFIGFFADILLVGSANSVVSFCALRSERDMGNILKFVLS
jgi:hypothetical protein